MPAEAGLFGAGYTLVKGDIDPDRAFRRRVFLRQLRSSEREVGYETFDKLLVSLLVPAFVLAGVAASPAMAQDKAKDAKAAPAAKAEKGKPTQKALFENDKVRVTEVTFKPGDESDSVARPARVVRTLKGGTTLMRTYPDGKTQNTEYKTVGEVKWFDADAPAFKLKNVGKSDLVILVVNLKEPKK